MTRTTNNTGTTPSRWESQRRRRGASCLSDLTLDRLEAGELASAEAATATGHLSVCGACAEARASLLQARDRFRAEQNIPALAADALARASVVAAQAGRARWRSALATVGLCAGAAAAVMIFRPLPVTTEGGPGAAGNQDIRRTKGSLTLGVFVQHPEDGSDGKLHLGEPLHPGDRLRFKVTSDRAGHVAVLGIDRTGAVSVFHPQLPASGTETAGARAESARAAPLSAGAEGPLPTAVELDSSLGDEVLLAVRCADPLPLDEIVAAARKGAGTDGTVALPCAQARYRITKVQLGSPAPAGKPEPSRPAATP